MGDLNRIRVMTVDDHQILKMGIKFSLMAFDDLEFVGEACNGSEAVQRCGQFQPDVILMDIVMPTMDGVTATRAIREQYPKVQVVVLTSFQDETMVRSALQAGAIGYLLKGAPIDEIAAAIRAARGGRPTLSAEVAPALLSLSVATHKLGDDLTARQLEVLELVVDGLSNEEIAGTLYVSPSTIRHHVSEILSKLHASNRAEAAALAVRHKLVASTEQDYTIPAWSATLNFATRAPVTF